MITDDQLDFIGLRFSEVKTDLMREMASYPPSTEYNDKRLDCAAQIHACEKAFTKLSNQIKDSLNDTRN